MSEEKSLKKLNCWEFKNCGRESGGEHSYEMRLCPAAKEPLLDGVHDGKEAGRACWVVAGTLCASGKPQGVFAKKYDTCKNCDFYRLVIEEENSHFEITLSLMNRLRKN